MGFSSAAANWTISSRFWPLFEEANDETRRSRIAARGDTDRWPRRADPFRRVAELRPEFSWLALQRADRDRYPDCRTARAALDLSDRDRGCVRNNAAGVRWLDVRRRTVEQFLGSGCAHRPTRLALPENAALATQSVLRGSESWIRRPRRQTVPCEHRGHAGRSGCQIRGHALGNDARRLQAGLQRDRCPARGEEPRLDGNRRRRIRHAGLY